jgi:predicted CXXCH cytochrome family protein
MPADFVGSAACIDCHTDEATLWRGSHHDLAMRPATGETVLGDFADAEFTYAGVTSTFFRRDGRFWVRTDGEDGEMGEWPIDYTFGFDPLQQYLVDIGAGRYQALTIAWDSRPAAEGGRRWFHIYSEEDAHPGGILHWTGPYMNWNYMCAECHSTNLRKNYSVEKDVYETSWSEIDVACESCHGPGSRHVELVRDGGAGSAPASGSGFPVNLGRDDGAAWVFDEGAATAHRRAGPGTDAVSQTCGRCHSRRTWIWDEYRYGQPLLDTHRVALLEENLYHADGQILEEVYVYGSFLQSRMHRAGVICIDCHDPHSARLRADGNNVCAPCHKPEILDTPEHHFHRAGEPGARCVDCHMIVRDYMVVDPRRDHSFRVPRPDLTAKLGTPNACNDCHADRPAQWAADELRRRFGPERVDRFHYGEALHAGWHSRPGAERLLALVAGNVEEPGIVRATALSLLPRFIGPSSRSMVERALRDHDPLVRIGAVRALEAFPPEERLRLARPLLDDPVRTVRLEATRLMAEIPPAGVPRDWRPVLDAALDEYRQAQLFNADRAEAHLNLGWVHMRLDQPGQAEDSFRKAIAIQPRFIPAYLNLADLYRSEERDEEGEKILRQAIAIQPDSADAHHSLGLLLARRRQLPEAIEALRSGAELAPAIPHYAYVCAVALEGQGEIAAALEVLEEAQKRHPIDREILSALATYNEKRGDLDAAARWARMLVEEWPDDPRWKKLAGRIEQRRQAR